MPDREKVIKGLEVCIDREPGKYDCYKCPYETDGNDCEINLSKDALALLKEQEPGWISVNDRLPEENQDVLIYGYWRGASGTVYKEIDLASMKDFIYEGYAPIAWMPLPEPPKEEK